MIIQSEYIDRKRWYPLTESWNAPACRACSDKAEPAKIKHSTVRFEENRESRKTKPSVAIPIGVLDELSQINLIVM